MAYIRINVDPNIDEKLKAWAEIEQKVFELSRLISKFEMMFKDSTAVTAESTKYSEDPTVDLEAQVIGIALMDEEIYRENKAFYQEYRFIKQHNQHLINAVNYHDSTGTAFDIVDICKTYAEYTGIDMATAKEVIARVMKSVETLSDIDHMIAELQARAKRS